MTHLFLESKLSHGYAQCKIVLTGDGVEVARLSGIATTATVERVLAGLRAGAGRAFCMQADRAVLTLGADYMEAAANARPMSGALVVDVGMLETMREYARRMARLGIVRKVFTSRVKALTWASEQAQLAVAQEQWERARCPSP